MLSFRDRLAMILIGGYVCLTLIAIIYPALRIPSIDLEKFSGYVSKVSSPLTGLVGVVVGYYFAKSSNPGSIPGNDVKGHIDPTSTPPLATPSNTDDARFEDGTRCH